MEQMILHSVILLNMFWRLQITEEKFRLQQEENTKLKQKTEEKLRLQQEKNAQFKQKTEEKLRLQQEENAILKQLIKSSSKGISLYNNPKCIINEGLQCAHTNHFVKIIYFCPNLLS